LSRVKVTNSIIFFSPVPKYDANDIDIFAYKDPWVKIKKNILIPFQCGSDIAVNKLYFMFCFFISTVQTISSHKCIDLSGCL